MSIQQKWFKSIIFMLLMIALLITSIPITTQASETKVTSGSKNTTAGDGHWGSSYKRTGWLVYLVKKSNGKIPTVDMTINGEVKNVKAVNYVGYTLKADGTKLKYVTTRVEQDKKLIKPQRFFESKGINGAEWGAPFDNDQHGRGKLIKNFFVTYKASEKKWIANKGDIKSKTNKYQGRVDLVSGKKEPAWNNDLATVNKYLGSDASDKYETGNYYLCLEAVAIHEDTDETKWVAFSASGSARLMREDGNVQIYTPKFSSNNALQIGTYLDKNWPNLPKAVPDSWKGSLISRNDIEKKVKAKTNSTVNTMGYGFGMVAMYPLDPPVQRTYDEESLTPSAAPKETTGKTTIVKVYVEEYEVDIPKALIDTTISTTVTKTDNTEIETTDEPISEDATVSKTPDRDDMTVEEVEALDRDKDRDEGIVDDLMGELTDSIAGTDGMVYDPDDEATYGEVSIDETKEDMTDDVGESDSKFSGSIDESEAGASDVYDTDDYDDSGEEEDATAEVDEDDDTFDPTTSTTIEIGADVDIDHVTVKSYRQVEKVTAGKGGCESSEINPGVAVTKQVGNEILILDESGDAKDVKGGT